MSRKDKKRVVLVDRELAADRLITLNMQYVILCQQKETLREEIMALILSMSQLRRKTSARKG